MKSSPILIHEQKKVFVAKGHPSLPPSNYKEGSSWKGYGRHKKGRDIYSFIRRLISIMESGHLNIYVYHSFLHVQKYCIYIYNYTYMISIIIISSKTPRYIILFYMFRNVVFIPRNSTYILLMYILRTYKCYSWQDGTP